MLIVKCLLFTLSTHVVQWERRWGQTNKEEVMEQCFDDTYSVDNIMKMTILHRLLMATVKKITF